MGLRREHWVVARSVVVLGYPGVQALDLVGPFEVFTGATIYLASQGRGDEGYSVTVVSADGEPATTRTGLALVAQPLPDPREPIDTLVLPGGIGVDAARQNPDVIGWIQIAADTPVASSASAPARSSPRRRACSTAASRPRTGRSPDRWHANFPRSQSIPSRSSSAARDKVWTAAGVTAGIDLALSLVEDDYGTDVAQTVARWLVLYLRRPGGQTQFAAPVWMPRAKRAPIRDVQEAIESEPGGAHSIPELARRAAMSPRHFTRVFTDEVGRGARRLRRAHPHRSRPPPARGDRRHRDGDRGPMRLRHRRNHAPQFRSTAWHFARPIPQDIRLTKEMA